MIYSVPIEADRMYHTILIVEDNVRLRKSIADVLRIENYRVIEAGEAALALTLYEQFSPQLVLLDIGLPDGDGLDLIGRMRTLHDSYIIMFTSLKDIDSKALAYRRGADDYLCKPFDLRELILKLGAVGYRIETHRDTFIIGDVNLDITRDEISCREKKVPLTHSQAVLLRLLLERHKKGTYLPFEEIRLLDDHIHSDTQLHLRITRLRKALTAAGTQQVFIESLYGEGYTLVIQKA